MPKVIYHLTTPEGDHAYYSSLQGLIIDNAEDGLPVGQEVFYRYNWKENDYTWQKKGWIVRKGKLWSTKEVREHNLSDLPDDAGAEHFDYD